MSEQTEDVITGDKGEMRRLLSELIDSLVLLGHPVTRADWDRACLLAGRCCEPFLSRPAAVGGEDVTDGHHVRAMDDPGRDRMLRVVEAARDLFSALDDAVPEWRDTTITDGDEVNACWRRLDEALREYGRAT